MVEKICGNCYIKKHGVQQSIAPMSYLAGKFSKKTYRTDSFTQTARA